MKSLPTSHPAKRWYTETLASATSMTRAPCTWKATCPLTCLVAFDLLQIILIIPRPCHFNPFRLAKVSYNNLLRLPCGPLAAPLPSAAHFPF